MSTQPEALRLADALEFPDEKDLEQAAAELRRLHAENEQLQRALRGAKLGSHANFVSMQQQAALKSELLAALEKIAGYDLPDEAAAADVARKAIAMLKAREA